MNSFYKTLKMILAVLICSSSSVFSQTTKISGTVRESDTKEPLAGVNITVKDLVIGTISNRDGEFNLEVNQVQPPFSVIFSMVGYKKQELIISEVNTTGLEITMEIEKTLIQEIVVSASRLEDRSIIYQANPGAGVF